MKEQTIIPAGVMRRAWALLLAAALCLGLMPSAAWAEESEGAGTFSVALTIVDTSDPADGVLYNGKVDGMTSDDTVADLLAKAGFTAAASAEETEGNDKAYFDSWGSPTFRGNKSVQQPDGSWAYWATMFDGDSANYASAQLTSKLQENGRYQYIYTSDATFAYDEEASGFPVQLTIVDTSDPVDGVLYNGKVDGMTSDDTVADLLAKAGFTAAASAEETEGNDKAYFDSWGSPTFRGNKSVQQPDGSWAYWATMFDGDSANYASAQLTSKLQENGRYQYIYTSDATFAYDDEVPQLAIYTVNDPLAGAIKPDPKPEPEPDEPANDAVAVDSAAYNTLFGTIASSYAGTSEEWKALELAAAGRVSSVDVATLVANAKAANGSPETTNLQRFILALTAVGKTEEAAGLVQTMATSDISTTYVNGQAFALLSYESGAYDVPANALETEAELVAKLLSAQQASGGWTWKGAAEGDDPDTTAMVITALASRVSDASVKAAVDKGLEALRAMQHEDGGFRASGDAADGPINVSSTSCVVVALCALGADPAASMVTESGATPLSALLSQATSDLSGFVYNGAANDLATEQGFRALVAYQGLRNTGAAYNVYTQAKLGQAALPADEREEGDVKPAGAPAADKKALAKTGDGSAPFAAGTAALALGALAAGIAATRRMRASDEFSLRR
ncbi:terpene cyclase/mutase family protein [Eggerthella guodeyinii]|uniref:Terpene cyclase/mutase family protein n=1 Tax=Eggerthella guodeyinii TaxID=2690837 RepID=A0A7M1ZXJ0_9ACTN|nr:prenyltransferase/squalene oxidase repeat-containing protein [Eggerthella guodeyinii]QOS69205.1 terpene cyclase/mutase family protein [Eggerthella guodeyinii]